MGALAVSFADEGTSIVPSGPVTVLRALLWLASGRRRRAVRRVVDRLSDATGRPVHVRVAPGVRIPVAR
ncbi:MAG TPA: hypothetical protein VJ925_13205 [Longimicrobiales bacterium]|nr:hypothetical protein [Longimicrobiales bacterium]